MTLNRNQVIAVDDNSHMTCNFCHLSLPEPDDACPYCGAPLDEERSAGDDFPTIAEIADTLSPENRYQILSPIGKGATGVVYMVHDTELDDVIAVKVLKPVYAKQPVVVRRFKRELKIARRINHPNVARLYEMQTWFGRLAITQEYIEGQCLEKILQGGPLPLLAINRYLRYLCSGLQAAHRLDIIHGDFKPANVLVDKADRPHILDFGTAILVDGSRQEHQGSFIGTPWYLSPEQARSSDEIDGRADIYSLGVVLYRMALGQFPFPVGTPRQVLDAHLNTAPIPPRRLNPKLPSTVEAVILRCLAKDPVSRFQTAREVADRFEEALTESGILNPEEETQQVSDHQISLLLIDDDPKTKEIVNDLVHHDGILLLEASNAYEGIETALREKPDLILLDLTTPVLDGYEVLRILKAYRKTAEVPVVMLSKQPDKEEALLSKELGAVITLNKPLQADILELVLEKYVD